MIVSAVVMASAAHVAPGASATPAPVIRHTGFALIGHNPGDDYFVEVVVKPLVCGQSGREVVLGVGEFSSQYGRFAPIDARGRHRFIRRLARPCVRFRLSWTLADRFFGVGRYWVRPAVGYRGAAHLRPGPVRYVDTSD
jgi:hypothetical protein